MAQHNNMICWVLGQIDAYYDSIMACSNERSHNNKRTLFNIINVTLTNINMRRFSNIYGLVWSCYHSYQSPFQS